MIRILILFISCFCYLLGMGQSLHEMKAEAVRLEEEDPNDDVLTISLWFSDEGGETFPIECMTVSGDVGLGIESGIGKHIVWDAGVDYPGISRDSCYVKVIADDES